MNKLLDYSQTINILAFILYSIGKEFEGDIVLYIGFVLSLVSFILSSVSLRGMIKEKRKMKEGLSSCIYAFLSAVLFILVYAITIFYLRHMESISI